MQGLNFTSLPMLACCVLSKHLMPGADWSTVRGGALHVMRDEALYSRIPLRHEACQPIQVSVARIDERKISKAVYACQVMASPDFCPKLPACARSP